METNVEGMSNVEAVAAIVSGGRDVLAPWLDKQYGRDVKDPSIFRKHAAHWEEDFFGDMDALNVSKVALPYELCHLTSMARCNHPLF